MWNRKHNKIQQLKNELGSQRTTIRHLRQTRRSVPDRRHYEGTWTIRCRSGGTLVVDASWSRRLSDYGSYSHIPVQQNADGVTICLKDGTEFIPMSEVLYVSKTIRIVDPPSVGEIKLVIRTEDVA